MTNEKNKIKRVLAIETSCDDTSVAIVEKEGWVSSMRTLSQDSKHEPFGGIVPEIAHRNHSFHLLFLIEECLKETKLDWSEISGIAVTSRPGLIGSLLVGLLTAKTLSLAKKVPFIAVNHLEAHLLASFLRDKEFNPSLKLSFPFLALIVSGGHTLLCYAKALGVYEVLGSTLDDAAGEAFDKFAKMLGFKFPGGAKIDQLAKNSKANSSAFYFPRPLYSADHLNFSFSGLKTGALRLLSTLSSEEKEKNLHSLCASFQKALVDTLIEKLRKALLKKKCRQFTISGGVSANSYLRARAEALSKENNKTLFLPPIRYCTDNAAMVGYAGLKRMERGEASSQNIKASSTSYSDDFIDQR